MNETPNIGQPPIQPPPPRPPTANDIVLPPPPPTQVPNIPENPKEKSFLKPLLFIFIFLLLAAGIYYLIFELNILETLTGKNLDNDITNGQDTQQEEEIVQEQLLPFVGEYISTQTPEGWKVEEYLNGEGTDMLATYEDGYTGLTGLKIFKGETEIFYMKAVSGLGFAGCPEYAKFTDENLDYYAQILEDNEISGMELTVTDYTTSEYEEFTWLNTPFRRIDKEYIHDTQLNNEYFESPCVPTLISFNDITLYSMGEDFDSSTYDYGATEIATEEDLLIVDQILTDMKLVVPE